MMPTKFGYIFAIGIFVMILTSSLYSNNLGFITAFFFGSIAITGAILQNENLKKLDLEKGKTLLITENTLEIDKISVFNSGSNPKTSFYLRPQKSFLTKYPELEIKSSQAGEINPGETIFLRLTIMCKNISVYNLDHMIIETIFPLGLFRAFCLKKLDYQIFSSPRPSQRIPQSNSASNQNESSSIHSVEDFQSHKNHELGEPISKIDWKVLARGLGLVTKTFETQSHQNFLISLDDLMLRNLEENSRQISRLIHDAKKHHTKYRVKHQGKMIAGQGPKMFNDAMKALTIRVSELKRGTPLNYDK